MIVFLHLFLHGHLSLGNTPLSLNDPSQFGLPFYPLSVLMVGAMTIIVYAQSIPKLIWGGQRYICFLHQVSAEWCLSFSKVHQSFLNMRSPRGITFDVRRVKKNGVCHSIWAGELIIILCQPSTSKYTENTWSIISRYWMTFVLHIHRVCHNMNKHI